MRGGYLLHKLDERSPDVGMTRGTGAAHELHHIVIGGDEEPRIGHVDEECHAQRPVPVTVRAEAPGYDERHLAVPLHDADLPWLLPNRILSRRGNRVVEVRRVRTLAVSGVDL